MRLRETPETDAAFIDELDVELVAAGSGRWKGDTKMELVPADFARKLERERDAAREALRSCIECLKGWQREFPELPAPFTEAALWDSRKILEVAE